MITDCSIVMSGWELMLKSYRFLVWSDKFASLLYTS